MINVICTRKLLFIVVSFSKDFGMNSVFTRVDKLEKPKIPKACIKILKSTQSLFFSKRTKCTKSFLFNQFPDDLPEI